MNDREPAFLLYCSNCGKPHAFWKHDTDPRILEQKVEDLSGENLALRHQNGSLRDELAETQFLANPFDDSGMSIANWLNSTERQSH